MPAIVSAPSTRGFPTAAQTLRIPASLVRYVDLQAFIGMENLSPGRPLGVRSESGMRGMRPMAHRGWRIGQRQQRLNHLAQFVALAPALVVAVHRQNLGAGHLRDR